MATESLRNVCDIYFTQLEYIKLKTEKFIEEYFVRINWVELFDISRNQTPQRSKL